MKKWNKKKFFFPYVQYAGELAVREEFPDATIFRPSAIYGNQYYDGFIGYHFSRCKILFHNFFPVAIK